MRHDWTAALMLMCIAATGCSGETASPRRPSDRLAAALALPGRAVQVDATSPGVLRISMTISSKLGSDIYVVGPMAELVEQAARALQTPPEDTLPLETLVVSFSTTAYDRLGAESVVPFADFTYSGRDLRQARLENLSASEVFDLATGYQVAGALPHNALFTYCAVYLNQSQGMCHSVFEACAAERRRTGSRTTPTCPAKSPAGTQ
ncbi:MAG: hypothetical protein AB1942_18445 [Pseudomonadota bacterium]